MKSLNFGRILLAALGLLAGSCNSRPPDPRSQFKLVPVHGAVRLNGKPVEGAHVKFENTKLGVSASGVTDAEGHYTLTTFHSEDGAAPGPQAITVTKVMETGHPTAKTAPPAFRRGGAPPPRWVIPQRYSNSTTSGLTREVNETGDNEIDLDLQGS